VDYLFGLVADPDVMINPHWCKGMPLCFSALLRGDVVLRTTTLFRDTILRLFAFARSPRFLDGQTHSVNEKCRVHALFVLRGLFRDGDLSLLSQPFVTAALSIAVDGMRDANWRVRNGSLNLFAAVANRAFRAYHLNEARSLSLQDLASIHADLPSLCAREISLSGHGDPRVIFPLLLLLTKLAPPTACSPDCLALLNELLPRVAHENAMVRFAAAKAVCCIIPVSSYADVFDSIVPRLLAWESSSAHSHNLLHGIMLLLKRLSEEYRPSPSQREKLHEALGALAAQKTRGLGISLSLKEIENDLRRLLVD
jgi:hypothetical protein